MNIIVSYSQNHIAHRMIAEKALRLYNSAIEDGAEEGVMLKINCIKLEFKEWLKENGIEETSVILPMYTLSLPIFEELLKNSSAIDSIFATFAKQDVSRGIKVAI